jgi:uncharacterized protein YdhG (YjbR/CyaY superfamily)
MNSQSQNIFVAFNFKNNEMRTKYKTVEEYLSTQPAEIKAILEELRKTIAKAATKAEEMISYNIPAFKLNGMLVWYAAFKEHIGFYPRASGIEVFKKELSGYKMAKGSVQFPIDEPLPLSLVSKIVKYRVAENEEEAKRKGKK